MSVSLTKIRFRAADAGCYLDGHWGWHNTYRVIDLAHEHGWVILPSDAEALRRYRDGDFDSTFSENGTTVGEWVSEMADEATEFLQSITAPGLYWDWDCGELSLVLEECEGHESLDGSSMGEATYCDGSCNL